MKSFSFYFLILFANSTACNVESPATPIKYFELKKYAESEIARFSPGKIRIRKNVKLNGKEETKTIEMDSAKWEKAFALFMEADITKAEFIGKYRVDSNLLLKFDGRETLTVSHFAKHQELSTRQLTVETDNTNGKVQSVTFQISRKNLLTTSFRNVNYIPGESLTISGFQKILFLDKKEIEIEIEFIHTN